jgi:hypothetical protein
MPSTWLPSAVVPAPAACPVVAAPALARTAPVRCSHPVPSRISVPAAERSRKSSSEGVSLELVSLIFGPFCFLQKFTFINLLFFITFLIAAPLTTLQQQ